MASIKVRFDGRVFVPEQPVHLPEGYLAEIPLPSGEGTPLQETTLCQLARIAEQHPENPSLPADFAAQHDHYLYGTPKKP